jgi:excinuclease ABC subunit C
MVDQMKRFLTGKTRDLLALLRREMDAYAEAMQFEEAAKIRDRIQAIENYTANQKIVFQDLSDKDIAAMAMEEDRACGVIFKIRDGKMIGRQHFYFHHVSDKSPEEVLENFLRTYYLQAEFIPKEIYLPIDPVGADILLDWVRKQSASEVNFIIPKIGEKHKLVEMGERNARLLLDELKLQKLKAQEEFVPRVLLSLQRDLNLKRVPRRIECFDNSNIQGSDPVASMVVFADGKPKKSEYRKFKIRTVTGPDDFASMHEVISRRYLRVLDENLGFPDLIVVDGGKGQLSAAIGALEGLGIRVSKAGSEGQSIIGLAKKMEEIFVPDIRDSIMIPKTSSSIRLLQHVRDEAHRFAITFHRDLREKRTIRSELDAIDGIGEKRRNALLSHFGSVKQLSEASVEEIGSVGGISNDLAKKIYDYFADADVENEDENE